MNNSKKIIGLSLLLCFVLGLARVAITGNSDYLFMPWNLFLALAPLLLALNFNKFSGKKLWLLAFFWLLFLPNSFYVVTDIIHLNSPQVALENIRGPYYTYDDVGHLSIVYDALYLFVCSVVSFAYGLESIRLFKNKFIKIFKKSYLKLFLGLTFFLSGIAIYLGRYVRLNSWDIVVRPWKIFMDIINIFIHPTTYVKEWLVILSFSFVIAIMYYIYDLLLRTVKNSKN